MKRRESLKLIGLGSVSTGLLVNGCNPKPAPEKLVPEETTFNLDRAKEEIEIEKKVLSQEKFFTEEEMATITVLADIIIPKDEVSGSASEAKVPEFIEFIVKDMPYHQVPLRGGLRWLDLQCLKRYEKAFKDCSAKQQIEIVDAITYPDKAKQEMQPGVEFFKRMRDLTASGFYTSEIGLRDIGYMGNIPNQWNGIPAEVMKQYNIAYTEKELKECISFGEGQ